jgi:hypothetical protein
MAWVKLPVGDRCSLPLALPGAAYSMAPSGLARATGLASSIINLAEEPHDEAVIDFECAGGDRFVNRV